MDSQRLSLRKRGETDKWTNRKDITKHGIQTSYCVFPPQGSCLFPEGFVQSDDMIMKSCIEIILCMHFLKKWTRYTMLYVFICSYTGTANVFSMLISREGTCPNFISLTCKMYFVQFQELKYCAILCSCRL